MKRWLLVISFAVWLCAGTAEAGFGDAVKNGWTYMTSPVNCLVDFGYDLITGLNGGC